MLTLLLSICLRVLSQTSLPSHAPPRSKMQSIQRRKIQLLRDHFCSFISLCLALLHSDCEESLLFIAHPSHPHPHPQPCPLLSVILPLCWRGGGSGGKSKAGGKSSIGTSWTYSSRMEGKTSGAGRVNEKKWVRYKRHSGNVSHCLCFIYSDMVLSKSSICLHLLVCVCDSVWLLLSGGPGLFVAKVLQSSCSGGIIVSSASFLPPPSPLLVHSVAQLLPGMPLSQTVGVCLCGLHCTCEEKSFPVLICSLLPPTACVH